MNNDLLHTIKQALLSEPHISDSVVLARQTEDSSEEIIVYYIPQGPLDQAALQSLLSIFLDDDSQTIYLVPLFKLPLRTDGSTDTDALALIPVLDDEFIRQSEQTLIKQNGVLNAAIVRVHYRDKEGIRYHLDDLVPADSFENIPDQISDSATLETKVSSNQDLPSALVDGGILSEAESLQHKTLLDLLRAAAVESTNSVIRFVSSNGTLDEWRYSDLWERAERIYAGLSSRLSVGDKVIFQMTANQDILSTFWACQMGGFIPVIVEVPSIFQSGNQAFEKVAGLISLLRNPLVVADDATALAFSKVGAPPFDDSLKICRISDLKKCDPLVSNHVAAPDDIAFFNLSSGSTGIPKCIMLSHRNLLSRAYGTNQLCGYSGADVILNWLPFDHIGSISDWHIRCVLLKCNLVYVEKEHVIGDPINWLNLIDQFRVTHSWAPNFAFALINKKLETSPAPNWDLSCVKGLLTAGEAVSDSSVQDFIRTLRKFGFSNTAVQPAFGMAELGSGVTYFVPSETNPLRFHTLRKPSMGNAIERLQEHDPAATHFADLGPAIPGVSLRIVDNNNVILPMETVGRLQIKGDVVFKGYYENPKANEASFQADGWFNTGDLGFLSHGNLVIAGREKEVIIIKGANYYSHDLEETISQVEGIEPSYTAASGVRRRRDNEEKLAIFFAPTGAQQEPELIRSIRTQVANRYGVSPTYIIPLDKEQIPKTAIGKIQRSQLKKRLEAGDFDDIIKRVDLILGNTNTLPSWFYRSKWMPKQHLDSGQRQLTGTVLIVKDSLGLGDDLSAKLKTLGISCVSVTAGADFANLEDGNFEIDLRSKSAFQEFFQHLGDKNTTITHIISLIDYQDEKSPAGEAGAYDNNPLNVTVFLNIIQALNLVGKANRLKQLLWVASDCHVVTAADYGSPEKEMMIGFSNALHIEHPSIECIHIDLALSSHPSNAETITTELRSYSKEPSIAYRNNMRYVLRLERLDLAQPQPNSYSLKSGGRYLVSGGLGGLGFELCRRLGRDYRAKLLVLGRSPLPLGGASEPQGSASSIGLLYETLVSEKIDITYIQADVSDRLSVLEKVAQVESTWGEPLDGIFHLAGIAHEQSVDEETIEGFSNLARPKCQGTLVMGELLKTRQGAFLVGFSSVNAFFSGFNAGSYSAVNLYLEAYCRQLFRSGVPALCYAWSSWDGLGMSKSIDASMKPIAAAKGFSAITAEEGFNSLRAAISSGQAEALIGLDATKNTIRAIIDDTNYEQQSVVGFVELADSSAKHSTPETMILQDRFGSRVDCRVAVVDNFPMTADGKVDKSQLASLADNDGHTKKKPTNPVESGLIELWRELLKVTDIGTQDNFFELGGDSLLTVQLIVLIEKTFKVLLPASTIFHAPTVEQLAAVLSDEKQVPDFFSLVPIKADGSKPPLYIVQSDSWELVRYLDSEQPVYGLNFGVGSKTLEEKLALPGSLAEIAAHFISEIRSIQPEGPYFLIGHSNAGILAYEMAQQLAAEHQTVGLLGMIDTYHLPALDDIPSLSLAEKLQTLAKLPLNTRLTVVKKLLIYYFTLIKQKLLSKNQEKTFLDRAMHLYMGYVPTPYPGKISFFKCTKQSRLQPIASHERLWGGLAQDGINIHPIDCYHDDVLLVPHVKLLADQITEHLENYYKAGN